MWDCLLYLFGFYFEKAMELPEIRTVHHDGLTMQQLVSMMIHGIHWNPIPIWLEQKEKGRPIKMLGLISGPFYFIDSKGQKLGPFNEELSYQNFHYIVCDLKNTVVKVEHYREVAKRYTRKRFTQLPKAYQVNPKVAKT